MHHHSSRHDPWATRLFAKIERDQATGCWNWTASTRQGYGQIWTPSRPGPRRLLQAHRAMYELANGAIPDGLDLDHLCPVTHRENVLRGDGLTAQNARKKTCVEGHPLVKSSSGSRYCEPCRSRRIAAYRLANPRPKSAARLVKEWAVAVGLIDAVRPGQVPYRIAREYEQHSAVA